MWDAAVVELVPNASNPAHADEGACAADCDACCCARCFRSCSASAARWAIVRFVLFEDCAPLNPDRRSLNASPFPSVVPVLAAFCIVFAATLDPNADDCAGVTEREATVEDELAAASIEKTSFCGLRAAG